MRRGAFAHLPPRPRGARPDIDRVTGPRGAPTVPGRPRQLPSYDDRMNADARDARLRAGSLVLRPWLPDDLGALLDAYRDPAIRAGSRAPVADEAAGAQWLRAQDEGHRHTREA